MRIENSERGTRNSERRTFYSQFLILLFVICGNGNCRAAGIGEMEKSVVMLRSAGQDFDPVTPWKSKAFSQGVGSGLIIDGNRVLTNAHNVSNNKYVELQKENVAKRFPAKVAFIGHDCDLAVLTVDDPAFFDDTIPLKFAGLPVVNTKVSTYGFPVGGRRISVTEGVVSRIQVDVYAHTGADSHLVIQTDAAINPGNSGGPVIQDGNVVGVAFQGLRQAENIGYMIPTTVIRHFLDDINDGKYDGFGSLGVMLYPGLQSPSYREYLKVPAGQQGIVIIDTLMHSSVESILKRNDVLVQIGDKKIDNDGRIEIYGLKLNMSEAVEAKQIGQKIEIEFYRDGVLQKATATVALNRPVLEIARQYDLSPRYVCFGGFVFVPVTRNYLETWGPQWLLDMPFYLRYLFLNSMQLNKDRQRREYVALSEIMSDELNAYADSFKSKVIESINDTPIWALNDVWQNFEKINDGYYVIKFMEVDQPLIMDVKAAKARQTEILKKYDIPSQTMLEVSK